MGSGILYLLCTWFNSKETKKALFLCTDTLSGGDRQQIKTVTANSVKCSEETKNRLMK